MAFENGDENGDLVNEQYYSGLKEGAEQRGPPAFRQAASYHEQHRLKGSSITNLTCTDNSKRKPRRVGPGELRSVLIGQREPAGGQGAGPEPRAPDGLFPAMEKRRTQSVLQRQKVAWLRDQSIVSKNINRISIYASSCGGVLFPVLPSPERES